MPQVNLAKLSAPELRRLLDSTRGRGDAALSYKILQEMAARRDAGGRLSPRRRPAEPRIIEVNLGEPEEPEDDIPPMPRWRPPAERPQAAAPPEPEPELAPAPEPEPAEEAAWDLRLDPVAAPPRRSRAPTGFALGLALTFALGGVGGWFARDAATPAAASVAAPPSAPVPAPTAPEVLPEPPPPPVETVAVEPEAETPAPEEAAPVETADLAPEPPPAAAADDCATAPTPADREICRDPELQRLQADLRQAYAKALEAHEDRALLRQRQLAWRDARNDVTDPSRLAALYEQRIRRLDAATAEAMRAR